MKSTKLLLATAIAVASTSAFALEALDEQGLSDTTGQAGLDINIVPPGAGISFSVLYHDADGVPTTTVAGSTYTNAGAIVIGNPAGVTGNVPFSIANSDTTNGFLVKVDAGASGTTGALLNINVGSAGTTTIHTGDVRVGVSGASTTGLNSTNTVSGIILPDMTITVGSGTSLMNIQLGNEQQGSMIRLTPTFGGGLSISNFTLNDAGGSVSGGGIKVTTTSVKDCGAANCASAGANLSMVATVDASNTGLQIGVTSLGNTGNGGAYVRLAGVFLGNTSGTSIGDVEIFGLNPANTNIRLTGH